MGENSGDMEKHRSVTQIWGFRPWQRHSLIVMVFGILFVLVGLNYIFGPSPPARQIALAALLQIAPIWFWGWVFVIAGIFSILSSRWPSFNETWGYIVLTSVGSGWGAAYLTGIFFFGSPVSNYSQVLLWAGLSFAWWGISGLSNPVRREE